jgi:hypothetical protein
MRLSEPPSPSLWTESAQGRLSDDYLKQRREPFLRITDFTVPRRPPGAPPAGGPGRRAG